jgi:ankyrin repeat protein
MQRPQFPLELLLMVANEMRDSSGELRYADFNSFLQVNRALYACLNPTLWRSAGEHYYVRKRVFTHLIRTDNLARLKVFMELGADVETVLPEFNDDEKVYYYDFDVELQNPTPLLVAASFDNVPLARLLLENGADVVLHHAVNVNRPRYSAMHAARSGEMVQLLLDHHADPNQLDDDDDLASTPLYYYIMRGNLSAMRVALENGAEIGQLDVCWAAGWSIDAAMVMLDYGAKMKENTLHFAAAAGWIDVMRVYWERWPEALREENSDGCTPLHSAAAAGRADMVRFLVARWPEGKKALDSGERTPLMLFEEKAMNLGRVNAATREEMVSLLSIE